MANAHALPATQLRDPATPWIIERLYVRIVWLVNRIFPGPERLAAPFDDAARASAAARPPIVLVYGMGCSANTWDTWRRSLVEDGFWVHVIELPRNNMGSARDGAAALAAEIDAVRAEHGCDQVQLVGFSFGGIVSRTYLQFLDGWERVERLVTVATPHHGSRLAPSTRRLRRSAVARRMNQATKELGPDSAQTRALAAGWRPDVDGPRCTSIYAPAFDGFVSPWTSPELPGATNVALPARTFARASWSLNHHTIVTRDVHAYETARRSLAGA
jgi:triacylglycerol lipase